jgi:hypothetical protein
VDANAPSAVRTSRQYPDTSALRMHRDFSRPLVPEQAACALTALNDASAERFAIAASVDVVKTAFQNTANGRQTHRTAQL